VVSLPEVESASSVSVRETVSDDRNRAGAGGGRGGVVSSAVLSSEDVSLTRPNEALLDLRKG
jgi:hypothetical protein